MSGYKQLEREVFGYCSETCPEVDRTFTDLTQALESWVAPSCWDDAEAELRKALVKVKEVGTDRLRDALREAVKDKISAEDEVESLKREVAELESQCTDLRYELKEAMA